MGVRSGYLHAIEGVLAAIIVVLYLNSIITVPPPMDWTETSISKRSEDVLAAMDQSGFLDEAVMRDDLESFNTFLQHLDSSLQYQIDVSGLPHTRPRVAVLVNNTSTYEIGEVDIDDGRWSGSGLPDSENDRYRQGNLSDHSVFGDVGFVLSDTENNSFLEYTSVNLDLDGDNSFGDAGEGPFTRGDTFTCDKGVQGCSGQHYGVAPFNDTLVLYNASLTARLQDSIANTTIGERTVEPVIETANPARQSLDPFNALITTWNASELGDHRAAINASLEDGALLVIAANVAESSIDSGYLNTLGFSYIEAFDINGTGDTDVFYSLNDPRNGSYYPAAFYGMGAVTMTNFSGGNGTLTVQRADVGVKRYGNGAVAFGTEDYAANYTTGDTVTVRGNTYTVQKTSPLELRPDGQQRFYSYETARVEGDFSVMRMLEPRFNTSAYDTEAFYTPGEAYPNSSWLPGTYSQGVVGSNCADSSNPFRMGEINVSSINYTFLLVNIQTEEDEPCDDYYEFVYFDLTKDGDFDDGPDMTAGHSEEGPYQQGDTVTIPTNQSYTVDPFQDGNGTALNRVGPRFVGELPVNREVFDEGTTALIGRDIPGHDDLAVINALILSETREETAFTAPQTLGDVSVGYTYTAMTGDDVKLPYTLNTVWWFR